MKEYLASICFVLLIFSSCSKDSRMENKVAGSWLVESVMIYMLNADSILELNTTLLNVGTINFIDENRNKHRNKDYPDANPIEINLTPMPGSIAYLYQMNSKNITWSVEMPKRGKVIQLALSTIGNQNIYYFTTYSANFQDDNTLKLLYYEANLNSRPNYDNNNVFEEHWVLKRQ